MTLSEIARRAAGGLDLNCGGERRAVIHAILAQPLKELAALVSSTRAYTDDDPAEWLVELRTSLPTRLSDRRASLQDAARAHAMSPRSLQRRLAEAGTTWRSEVQTARRALAAALSAEGARNGAIARQLGYSDARALRRAMQRWNGQR